MRSGIVSSPIAGRQRRSVARGGRVALGSYTLLRRCFVIARGHPFRSLLFGLLLGVVTVGSGYAQSGTVTGSVIDARTLQPVGSAQVFNSELGIGVLTRDDGRFLLADVPAGTHTFSVQLIGFREASQQVTVAAGETVTVNFELAEDALALDAVVVTGTAGGTRQRAVGNVVGRVDAAAITAVSPVQTVQDLLASREPGLSFARSSGNIGTGSQIRIRGVSSLTMNSQPLIYVDGVRVDNQGAAGPDIRDGRQVSKLDDFSPDQIESIEVIKGPAAATLYGTEASAGVIQIITKKGASGAPQFDVSIRQGTSWLQDASEKIGTSWGRDPDTGEVLSFNIWDAEKAAGRQFFDSGHLQSYSVSMRGGTDAIRYYVSADLDDNVGIVDYNWDEGLSTRANLTIIPSSTITMDLSTGYVGATTSFMQQYTGYGAWEQAQWASPVGQDRALRGFLRARPEEIANVSATRENTRFTTSGTITHQPWEWLTQRFIVGTDVSQEKNEILFPRHPDGANHDFLGLSLGTIIVEKPYTRYNTADYAISAQYGLSDDLRFTSSFGAQYYDRFEEVVLADGQVFPSPAIRSLGGAASTTSSSTQVQNKSVGMYLQQEMSLQDRIFLTAAVRGDDNSAFGSNYDAAIYPKFSATWVISEEPFWRWGSVVNSLRLRSAVGKAGRQPDTFAGVTLYAPRTGPGGNPAVSPDLLGNPDLGPEVSTEIEAGFDAAFLDDRISTQFTYYRQNIKDALLDVPVPWSAGFPGSQSVNLGELSNWGWEWAVDSRAFESRSVALDVGFALSSTQNRIEDLAGQAETNSIRQGYNYPLMMRRQAVSAEFDEDGRVTGENLLCDAGTADYRPGGETVPCDEAPVLVYENGFGVPVHEGNFNATITLFNNLRLHGLVDWQGEHYRTLTDASCRHTCFGTSEVAVKRDELDEPWAPFAVAAIDGDLSSSPYTNTFDASFARVRELGASYNLPESLTSRLRASRASLNVSARNLWFLYRAQTDISGAPVHDPEARGLAQGGAEGGGGNVNTGSNSNVPPLATFLVTLRASF
ncbi:MAG: TonB-dependent receptor [Gemmatimonas sp.]|nr:TonB-dependent receptor [Gemmatimonas sp.]